MFHCRNLTDLAKEDEELAELIREADGDPAKLEAKMRAEMEAVHNRMVLAHGGGSGEEIAPKVAFRDIDPFDVWIWIELYTPPTGSHTEMLQEVLNSWFMLGRLGAYNSSNLQVLYSDGASRGFEYEISEEGEEPLSSTMHDMGELECQGPWVRFWVDMGTSDEMGFDILINALTTFSREHVGIRQIIFGGANDDWGIPAKEFPSFALNMDPQIDPDDD